jgi:D-lactate dehydrogenase (cytochrome)
MLIKTNPDEIRGFLEDASNLRGGYAERVMFPETSEEISDILAKASHDGVPVTVAGAGTGVVGGRIPFGGIVIATDKLHRIKDIRTSNDGGSAVAECGVRLVDFQRTVESKRLLYPPDPTERSCFLGATVATNSSGSRTFKYGPTRKYIAGLKIILSTGDIINLKRGEIFADGNGNLSVPISSKNSIDIQLPSYRMPDVRKNTSGYFITPNMDVIDLFIGSEGTLGVISEVETILIPKPDGILSGVVFFRDEAHLLAFVRDAREHSFKTRSFKLTGELDARALEYFDVESLRLLREVYLHIPEETIGAIFFEQETSSETEESLMLKWSNLLEKHNALLDNSWFGTTEKDQAQIREFRHHLPVLVNEWLSRHNQRKVSTDMAVPDDAFPEMLQFYKDSLTSNQLRYVIFGHIGDNHVHVNILPRNEDEAGLARNVYLQFVRKAVSLGGTISAEHGIGKLKRDYLRELYTADELNQMAQLKKAFDPAGILGQGNIF